MTEVIGKLNELQVEEYDKYSPDSEITRLRMIELMNYVYREAYQIGDVVESLLTYDQFRTEMGESWAVCDGSNIVSTDLGQLLSINNLPDLVSDRGSIGQAYNELELGLEDTSQNAYHEHGVTKGANSPNGFSTDVRSDNVHFGTTDSGDYISNATQAMQDGYNESSFSLQARRQYNGGGAQGTEPDKANTSLEGTSFKGDSIETNIFIKVNQSRSFNG